jgi:hypothetical protein
MGRACLAGKNDRVNRSAMRIETVGVKCPQVTGGLSDRDRRNTDRADRRGSKDCSFRTLHPDDRHLDDLPRTPASFTPSAWRRTDLCPPGGDNRTPHQHISMPIAAEGRRCRPVMSREIPASQRRAGSRCIAV